MPISRVFDPYTGAANGGGEGTASPPALGAATDPEQSLASSATSWTVEWPAATGGDGSYTYTITVKDQAGNSVVPTSGSDEGPYVIPVVTPNAYIATLDVEDGAGLTASSSAMARVAAASAGTDWVLVGDFDFTGLDVAVLTGTGHVQKGGVNYGPTYKVVDHSSNLGTVTAGASGITIQGVNINSSLNCTFDIFSLLPIDPLLGPVWVDITLEDYGGTTGGSDGLRAGLVDSSGNFSTGQCYCLQFDYISGTTWNIKTNTTGATSTWLGTVTTQADNVVSLLIMGGFVAQAYLQQNSTTPPISSTIDAGGRTFTKTIAAGASQIFSSSAGFYVGAAIIWRPHATITRIRIHQIGGV